MIEKRSIIRIAVFMVLLLVCFAPDTGSVTARTRGVCDVNAYQRLCRYLSSLSGVSVDVISLNRTKLIGNIYKYSCILKVGEGRFDKIGIYRVVKEQSPWHPITADRAVMMVHGDSSAFNSEFLMSTLSDKVPDDYSLAIYLAKNDIDVWGVDRRWTFVPGETENFSFMEGWDTALHLRDLKLGVKLARLARWVTGNGFGRIFMLGHSRGAAFAYAYANDEAANADPEGTLWEKPDLRGIILIDWVYKLDPDQTELIENAYQSYLTLKALYDSGIYHTRKAADLKGIAFLAATEPDQPSPVMDGFTNMQAALFCLSATYLTCPEAMPPPVPSYHFCAGNFDEYGRLPTGLQFTDIDYMFDFAFAVPSFQSLGEQIDGEAIRCGIDTPYDGHLAEIKIPVCYVGVAGGFGEYGEYTLDLLGSTDTTSLLVRRLCGDVNCDGKVNISDVKKLIYHVCSGQPVCNDWAADINCDARVNIMDVWPLMGHVWLGDKVCCRQRDRAGEIGHIDPLFASPSAEKMVWKPICDWINSH